MNHGNYEEYKIKRNKYVTITIIIIIAFVVFEIICNFDYFLKVIDNSRNKGDSISVVRAKEILFEGDKSINPIINEPDFYVWSDVDLEQKDICVNMLENQKRSYKEIQELTEFENETAQALFVIKEAIVEEEAELLQELVNKGTQVIFVILPDETFMKQEVLLELLGIHKNKGNAEHEGFRFVPNFFATDELMEVKELEIEMYDCVLTQKTKTFAYALMNEIEHAYKNEELPPAVWRRSHGQGTVYVINGNFHEFDCLAGVMTGVIGQLVEDDIYPIINGYSVMINGLPYINEEYDARIEELYSRDAMGLQQDILFPDLVSSFQKNQYFPTFFCSLGAYDGTMDSYIKKQIAYMEKEIMSASGEIGLLYEGKAEESNAISYNNCLLDDGSYKLDSETKRKFDTIVTEDANDGSFIDYENKAVMIPIVRREMFEEEQDRLKEISFATTNGMVSVLIDIVGILQEEESNWVDYTKQCESVLGEHDRYYKDLSRLTATQLSERILAYQATNPVIEKNENEIQVRLDDFVGDAYFILRTKKEIVGIDNGSYVEMGQDAYLINAQDAEVRIHLKKETDIF